MMNPNWPRWIVASVAKHFSTALENILPMSVEGEDGPITNDSDYCELRIDGPFARERDKGDWELYIEINVLITSIKDERDAYKIHRNNGLVGQAFIGNISVYRYGNGEVDDSGLEGCLILQSQGRDSLVINNFGQVETDVRVMQSTVEGHYKGFFTE